MRLRKKCCSKKTIEEIGTVADHVTLIDNTCIEKIVNKTKLACQHMRRFLMQLQLAQNLPPNLLFAVVISSNNNDNFIADYELRVHVLVGIVAHDNCSIRQITEHTAAVLAGDNCQPTASNGMPIFGTVVGIDFHFLDGNNQFIGFGINAFFILLLPPSYS